MHWTYLKIRAKVLLAGSLECPLKLGLESLMFGTYKSLDHTQRSECSKTPPSFSLLPKKIKTTILEHNCYERCNFSFFIYRVIYSDDESIYTRGWQAFDRDLPVDRGRVAGRSLPWFADPLSKEHLTQNSQCNISSGTMLFFLLSQHQRQRGQRAVT